MAGADIASSRTLIPVRRTLLYRSRIGPTRIVPVTDTITVTQATVTFAGKTVSQVETIPVSTATVTIIGQTVTCIDVSVPLPFVTTAVPLRVRRTLIYRPFTTSIRTVSAVTDTVSVTQATVTFTGKTVTVLDAEVVAQATVTVFGKPITEFGLIPVNKATASFAGQTVALVDPGVDRITVDPAQVTVTGKPLGEINVTPVSPGAVLFTGQDVTVGDAALPTTGNDDVKVATTNTILQVHQSLLYRSLVTPLRVVADDTVSPATITFTGQPVTVSDTTPETVQFASRTLERPFRRGLLYRSLTVPPVVTITPVEVSFTSRTSIRSFRRGLLYRSLIQAPLVIPPIIVVSPAAILFVGQEVTVRDGGLGLPGGGGGITLPPWIVYGRKHRRRYRALEEIEKRLDERIKRLETEKAELDGGQQVGVQLAAPDLAQFLLNFEQLLNRQAAINAALLEAQRRAEAVRQERIQLAILAQRAAEAIDEEEATVMLLLTT